MRLANSFEALQYNGNDLIMLSEETAKRLGASDENLPELMHALIKLRTQSTGLDESVFIGFRVCYSAFHLLFKHLL